jgi:hypothetical protein
VTKVSPERPLPSTLFPANETERLAALQRYKVLDTPPEVAFDRITNLAARLFKLSIALISLMMNREPGLSPVLVLVPAKCRVMMRFAALRC